MRTSVLVERILKRNHKARNSDKDLIVDYLNSVGMNLSPHQEQILRDVSFESIRRTRQKFQEQGLYKADEPIAKERQFKSWQMQQVAPAIKPERIDRVIEQQPMFNLPVEHKRIDLG